MSTLVTPPPTVMVLHPEQMALIDAWLISSVPDWINRQGALMPSWG